MQNDWRIIFYRTPAGRRPVIDFLEEQDARTRNKIEEAIQTLEQRNVGIGYPLARPIEGKLWELRIEQQTNIYRVFYFFFTGRQIILLHAFQKKTQKTPNREIQIALKRMSEYL